MKIPMREKYVDEAVGVWLVINSTNAGCVHVVDEGCRDIFLNLPAHEAKRVVELQAEFREKLYDLLCPVEL